MVQSRKATLCTVLQLSRIVISSTFSMLWMVFVWMMDYAAQTFADLAF